MLAGRACRPSLLLSVGLYCAGGAFYNNRKYMLPFPDNLPQRDMWREVPVMGTCHASRHPCYCQFSVSNSRRQTTPLQESAHQQLNCLDDCISVTIIPWLSEQVAREDPSYADRRLRRVHAVMEGVDFTRSKLPAQLGGRTKDSYNPVTKEEEKEGGYDEF